MSGGVAGLDSVTLRSAPDVCRSCVWWQSRGNRIAEKERWATHVEDEWGTWGTILLEDDGRFLGLMQYGPGGWFPRAADLPAGPPSDDAALVTCSFVAPDAEEWLEKSLLLAAIGECRDRGARALEAFAHRDGVVGEPGVHRRHRTLFPRAFLDDFGFVTVRARGRVELCRLDLGGLAPVEEGTRARVLRVVQEAFTPPVATPSPR